jgi:hypothetical protein
MLVRSDNMSEEGNVRDNNDRFIQFKNMLNKECIQLNEQRTFSAINNLEKIINELQILNELIKQELISEIKNVRKIDIDNNLTTFYETFFTLFKDEGNLLEYLSKNFQDYFFIRKVHQLSHAHGVYIDEISENPNIARQIKSYYLFLLFLDYYETFPFFIRPMTIKIWESKKRPEFNYLEGNMLLYKQFNIIVPNLVIDFNKINRTYRKLRNKIAHSFILYYPNYILYSQDGMKVYKLSLAKIKKEINSFQNWVIVFGTEFDLKMLNIGLNGEDRYFDDWLQYFKTYNEDWQKIGPSVLNDNG